MPGRPSGKSSPAPAITPGQNGRPKMIRNSLYALAAALMTLGTFGSTIAAVQAGADAPAVQVA